jgi:AAA15 family ATPase/GTPase
LINRFRIFAGPNGSGKSTLFEQLKATGQIHTGIYVNADKIEKQIKANQSFNFNAYRVIVNETDFIQLIRNSGLYNATLKDSSFIDKLELKSGILKINLKKNSHQFLSCFFYRYVFGGSFIKIKAVILL